MAHAMAKLMLEAIDNGALPLIRVCVAVGIVCRRAAVLVGRCRSGLRTNVPAVENGG